MKLKKGFVKIYKVTAPDGSTCFIGKAKDLTHLVLTEIDIVNSLKPGQISREEVDAICSWDFLAIDFLEIRGYQVTAVCSVSQEDFFVNL